MVELVMLLLLLPHMVCKADSTNCPPSNPLPVPQEWYQPGSVLIGGIASQIFFVFHEVSFKEHPSQEMGFDLPIMVTKFYQHVLALAFAVYEVNKNPQFLPNITLGFHICDSCYNKRMTYRTMLDLLFKQQRFVPSYECGTRKNLLAIIGGLGSDISFHMADISGLYKIPQLTYGSFAQEEKDMMEFPFFYRMVPNEAHQFNGIVQMLRYFEWTWVGLFAADDENGDLFLQALEPLLSRSGICSAFTERIPNQGHFHELTKLGVMAQTVHKPIMDKKTRTFVLYGETMTFIWLCVLIAAAAPEYEQNTFVGKVWIMTAQIDFAVAAIIRSWDLDIFEGTFSVAVHSNEPPGFQTYLQNVKPHWSHKNGFLKEFWEQSFDCALPNPRVLKEDNKTCTGEEKLESLPGSLFELPMTGHSYSVYNAVYVVAHALNAKYSSRNKWKAMVGHERAELLDLCPWQLHLTLQGMSFNNSAGERVSFNDNKEMAARFDILNLLIFPNNSFLKVKVGMVDPNEGEKIILNENTIVWHWSFNQVIPFSICSEFCQPGFRKRMKEGEKFCCYDCVHCPEEKVSSLKDMDDCFECPQDQYPSQDHDRCTPKRISFLSYKEPLGRGLAVVAVSFTLTTVLVLGVFIKHKDTPLVKANNRDITYTLLVSLLFCFVCSLLFLGQPNKVMCLLQQSAFGIIFSVAVSCVLAKTITVVVAFMAVKPESIMKRWVGKRLSNSIILACSLVQAGLCIAWLGTFPPFPNLDMQSLTKEIIAECNAGSVVMFYLVLGYLALLSIISFTVAFLARKLPDSFNEAKFITFSMLVFCSVWLSFVPTYLSTKGKYMVAVEIFSILASSAGLLGCIFFPKCYIIVLKPELNKKEQLIKRKK